MNTITTATPVLEFDTKDFHALRGGKRAELNVGDLTIKFVLTNKNASYRYEYPKTRIFVDGEVEVDFSEAAQLSDAAGTRSRGESLEADKAWDRANRQVVKNQRALIEEAITAVPELAAVLDGVKLNHSRYAGCSMCKCSPGFIAQARVHVGAETNAHKYNAETEQWEDTTEVKNYQVSDIYIWKTTK